jgi:hypothetical protein
VSAGG